MYVLHTCMHKSMNTNACVYTEGYKANEPEPYERRTTQWFECSFRGLRYVIIRMHTHMLAHALTYICDLVVTEIKILERVDFLHTYWKNAWNHLSNVSIIIIYTYYAEI